MAEKKAFSFKMTRRNGVVEAQVQSADIEKIMKRFATGEPVPLVDPPDPGEDRHRRGTLRWLKPVEPTDTLKLYNVDTHTLGCPESSSFWGSPDQPLLMENRLNLVFFRLVGLETGLKLRFDVPLNINMMTTLSSQLKDSAMWVIREWLMEHTASVDISRDQLEGEDTP